MSYAFSRSDKARATPNPVALEHHVNGSVFGWGKYIHVRWIACGTGKGEGGPKGKVRYLFTYKSPNDMSALTCTFVWNGIVNLQTATSGNKEHRRSVTRLYANQLPI